MTTVYVDPRKALRFPALYQRDEPIVVCPFDDSLISGPTAGLEKAPDKLASMLEARPSAVLTFTGTVMQNAHAFIGVPTIINLSASTTRSSFTDKVRAASVEAAIDCSAAAVAVHVNVSSKHAPQMLEHLGEVVDVARARGIPVVGIMYPRGENAAGEREEFLGLLERQPAAYAELVGHCVQIGVDMGIDLIKTQYTGTPDSFRDVTYLAGQIPIVTAGGPMIDEARAIENAVGAMEGGAAGISFARNVFGRDDPAAFIGKVRTALQKTLKRTTR